MIVTGATVSHWDEKTGSLTIFSQWEGKLLFGMNDLTIDDQGSLHGGTFGIDINQFDFKSTRPPGSLLRIDPPVKTTKLLEGAWQDR